jgi:hypothetical protein
VNKNEQECIKFLWFIDLGDLRTSNSTTTIEALPGPPTGKKDTDESRTDSSAA